MLLGSDTNSWSAVQFFFIINLVNPLPLLKIRPVALDNFGVRNVHMVRAFGVPSSIFT